MTVLAAPVAETAGITQCRVLYLTHHLPWPAWSGGTMREFHLLAGLSEQFAIDMVAVSRTVNPTAPLATHALNLRSVELYPDESRRTIRRQRHSTRVRTRLMAEQDARNAAAVVHVEGGYLFHLLPEGLRRRACLIEHNIESEVLLQFARLSGDQRLFRTARRVAQLEERAWRSAAAVVAITPEDQEQVVRRTGRDDVRLVPNGCDHIPSGCAIRLPRMVPATALFLANYAYRPNDDALRWLLTEIWPDVVKACPDARLVLAGSGMSAAQRRLAAAALNVEVQGLIDDVTQVLDRADVLVSPLRAGGGIKMKVLEALRRGCPVITTSIGAQGIYGTARSALRIEDTAAGLTDAIMTLLAARGSNADLRLQTLRAGATLPAWRHASAALACVWTEVSAGRD